MDCQSILESLTADVEAFSEENMNADGDGRGTGPWCIECGDNYCGRGDGWCNGEGECHEEHGGAGLGCGYGHGFNNDDNI